jgi:hypothetical protein
MPNHVSPGSSAARQVIHVTVSDTSHSHVNAAAEDKQHEVKKSPSVVTTAVTTVPTKSPSLEDSASSDARNDAGSSFAYQLVEKVCTCYSWHILYNV